MFVTRRGYTVVVISVRFVTAHVPLDFTAPPGAVITR